MSIAAGTRAGEAARRALDPASARPGVRADEAAVTQLARRRHPHVTPFAVPSVSPWEGGG